MKAKNFQILFIATTGFVFPLIRQKTNMSKIDRYWWNIMFPNQKENWKLTGLGLALQGELPPVPAAGEDLPPPVEGGDARREHDVELLKQA